MFDQFCFNLLKSHVSLIISLDSEKQSNMRNKFINYKTHVLNILYLFRLAYNNIVLLIT